MTTLLKCAASAWLFLSAAAASAAAPPTPLFAADRPIRLTLQGPIAAVAGGERQPRDAVLKLQSPAAETLPVRLSPRGITRLRRDVCQFAPMRVDFPQPPAPGSLFHGQQRLKLVTHCRGAASFQQNVLLEYAAYLLFNRLTPASFRVRLANIDYVDERGRTITSRIGFFIEDIGDVAARNGVRQAPSGDSVALAALDPAASARVALFEYMIGNLDWSIRAGPPGDGCCHNSRLIGGSGGRGHVPVPYDFDFSGLVDAPYAVPPDRVPVRSVKTRFYRGYCAHNAQAAVAAAEFRARRPQLMAVFSQVPQMEERTAARARSYLDGFFADIADGATLQRKLLRTCVG